VLREHGIPVALFDPTLVSPTEGFKGAIELHRPDLIVVCEDDFNFLSKMCLARNREFAFRMSEQPRPRSTAIAVHGSDASDNPRDYLRAGLDAVLIGDVETTLLELASGKLRQEIAGLAWRSGNEVAFNPTRPLRTDLDSPPLPAWDLVEMDLYRDAWISAHGYFSLNVASSRGCPYGCNWCAKPIYGNSYHVRSAYSVAAELRQLKDAY
jgi:radical SAM superfamily enzyme YgiQ (UPF0313 family)